MRALVVEDSLPIRTAIRDGLDSLLDEAARRELTLRETLAFLVEREVARKDERRVEMAVSASMAGLLGRSVGSGRNRR